MRKIEFLRDEHNEAIGLMSAFRPIPGARSNNSEELLLQNIYDLELKNVD